MAYGVILQLGAEYWMIKPSLNCRYPHRFDRVQGFRWDVHKYSLY